VKYPFIILSSWGWDCWNSDLTAPSVLYTNAPSLSEVYDCCIEKVQLHVALIGCWNTANPTVIIHPVCQVCIG